MVIPDSVTSIGARAFYDCDKLSYNEYGNCKYLGNENNPYLALITTTSNNLSSYTIVQTTKVIADNAFYGCSRLTNITIPDSVTSIGNDAFYGCSSLTSVYYKGAASEWSKIAINFSGNSKLTNAARYYYSESQPTSSGNYWHYDENGEVAVW